MRSDLPAIALDVGQARIGLAVSDVAGRFVFGRGYIQRGLLESDIDAIKQIFEQEKAKIIVVGLPLRTDGNDSEQTKIVRTLAKSLEDINLPIIFQDERFSTKLTNFSLQQLSKQKRKEKWRSDEASAIAILQTYLDKTKI